MLGIVQEHFRMFRERLGSPSGASESVRKRIGVWERFGSVWKSLWTFWERLGRLETSRNVLERLEAVCKRLNECV